MGDSSKLASAPPPDDRSPAWHRDPLGVGFWRWWDGEQWTDRIAESQARQTGATKSDGLPWWRPGWRKMTWVVLIWCVLMAAWIVAAIGSDTSADCARETYRSACEAGSDVGKGIGVVVLWFVWFFGFVALSLIWFMTKPKGRECPACGENVRKGRTTCPACGHDFAAAASLPQPHPAP